MKPYKPIKKERRDLSMENNKEFYKIVCLISDIVRKYIENDKNYIELKQIE